MHPWFVLGVKESTLQITQDVLLGRPVEALYFCGRFRILQPARNGCQVGVKE